MNYTHALFDRTRPTSLVVAMDASLCCQGHVESCIIPDKARILLSPGTKVEFIKKFYVRGINGCFCEVKTSNKKYYVFEDLLAKLEEGQEGNAFL